MRRLLPFLLLLIAVPLHAAGPSAGSEDAAVRSAIDHYFQGHATGVGDHYRKVFHPDSKLFFVREGKLGSRTSEEYISGAKGTPAPDEAHRKRWVEWIDVTGDTAVAKIILDYPEVKFTDYFTLHKIDGKWMILNKSFFADRRKK